MLGEELGEELGASFEIKLGLMLGAGLGAELKENDGLPVGSQTIGSHGTSKTIAMYPSVESLGRLQASHSSMSKSSPM